MDDGEEKRNIETRKVQPPRKGGTSELTITKAFGTEKFQNPKLGGPIPERISH